MRNEVDDDIRLPRPIDDMSKSERINAYMKLIRHYNDLQSDATKGMLLELEA
jgi:hypothetical protein